jgi:hypothetical protein
MNRAPSGPGTTGVGPNAEDLDGVLGRFQEWANTRRDQPASKYGSTVTSSRGAASKKVNLAGGARELTYEEALRASSYRRRAYPEATAASPPALTPQPSANLQTESPELDSTTSPRHATITAGTPELRPASKTISSADSRTVRTIQSRASRAEMDTAAASIPQSRGAAPKSESCDEGRPPLSSFEPPVSVVSLVPEVTRLRSSTPARKPQRTQPTFREVLKGTAGLATSAKANGVSESKSIALSLRVSDADRARIQACAARANLSISAYLRQCALGVDALRDQIELAIGELQRQEALSAAPPGISAIPGILGRFVARWFRRLLTRNDYTAISLR